MTDAKVADLEARLSALEAGYDTYAWLVGTLLGVLTLGMIVLGFASFGYIRHVAEMKAERQADKTSRGIAERTANDYMQAHLPSVLAAYNQLGKQNLEGEGETIAAHPEGGLGDDRP